MKSLYTTLVLGAVLIGTSILPFGCKKGVESICKDAKINPKTSILSEAEEPNDIIIYEDVPEGPFKDYLRGKIKRNRILDSISRSPIDGMPILSVDPDKYPIITIPVDPNKYPIRTYSPDSLK